jgi:hypothetical protein
MACLQFDEPQDDLTVALAGLAHGPHAVDHSRLDWMKHWPRSRCMGHRAAPLGSVKAMASYAASVRATRIISGHLIPTEPYFHGANAGQCLVRLAC